MANLIDSTYFKGMLQLPNLTGTGVVTDAAIENLNWYIATYEPKYLRLVLGETLYNAMIAGLAANPIDARWTALKNKLIDSTNKLSCITGYVFYHAERGRFTSSVQGGQAKAKGTNSEIVTNTQPMRTAYDESIISGAELRIWLSDNSATYPEFTVTKLSALNFLCRL